MLSGMVELTRLSLQNRAAPAMPAAAEQLCEAVWPLPRLQTLNTCRILYATAASTLAARVWAGFLPRLCQAKLGCLSGDAIVALNDFAGRRVFVPGLWC